MKTKEPSVEELKKQVRKLSMERIILKDQLREISKFINRKIKEM